MTRYFLGVDVGSSKTHAVAADETGQVLGFGEDGAGNHEAVGYDGLNAALSGAAGRALKMAGLDKEQLAGAGFGVAGYDWPSERAATLEAIGTLGLSAPVDAVNDALLGVLAQAGWGVGVVSGTGCNCWGWDEARRRAGQVTGHGGRMGEAAGSGELVEMALKKVAHEWTRRGPATALTPAFLRYTGARDLPDLLEGVANGIYELSATAAPVVFQTAAAGDPVALELVRWAGAELGELAKAVIRQLEFEKLSFDVVQIGSMYDGSPLLTEVMRETIHELAPGARLVRLTASPAVGAVVLGMETVGLQPGAEVRARLAQTIGEARQRAGRVDRTDPPRVSS
jgi:N-acetylglucosamine kinase-like BadF-type ATPase